MSEIATKANTSSLSSYVLTTALSNYVLTSGLTSALALKTDKSTTDNSSVAWSSGASTNAYHALYTGTEALEIRTPTSLNVAMSIQGTSGGLLNEGNITFYRPVTMQNSLVVNTTNILTTLNSKANASDVYTKTESDALYTPTIDSYTSPLRLGLDPVTFLTDLRIDSTQNLNIANVISTSLLASKNSPNGGNVTISASNSGTSGFSSLYLQTTGSQINETGQLWVGQQTGLRMMTRTNHPLSFRAYSDEANVTVPTSIQILSNTSRDVNILTPLKCSAILSTFEKYVSIGSGLLSSANCLSVTGGSTFGGQMLASNIKTSGIVETNQIRIIGTSATNSVKIANVDGNEVANFANDYTCRLNGNTSTLGSLYCSAPIDSYDITTTNITARDTNGIFINNSNGDTQIRLYDSGSMIKNGDMNVLGNVAITGNLTITGYSNIKPYASLRVVTTGGTLSRGTTTGTIGTAGTTLLSQYGYLTNVVLTRGVAGATNAFIYTFTMPTAHPLSTNYIVNGCFRTGSSSDPSPNATMIFNVTSSTSFNVWVKTSSSIMLDGQFYVYTVP